MNALFGVCHLIYGKSMRSVKAEMRPDSEMQIISMVDASYAQDSFDYGSCGRELATPLSKTYLKQAGNNELKSDKCFEQADVF